MHYIFDFDGTLADSETCSILATQAAFKACRLPEPSAADIAYYMGIPIEQSFKDMAKSDLSEQAFDELLTTFRSYYQQFEQMALQLFPGINEALQQLKQRGVTCFVVSSKKTAVLKRNLQALQIDHFFLDCIGSDQVSHYKPHPEGILLLLARYQLQASDCVMVGDATFDLQMGKAAHCQTCAVTWGSHTKEALLRERPDFIVETAAELVRIGEETRER